MGPWNFHQYMHPFDGSLEFKAVSSDAMKPQLLRNFCEFPSTQYGISIITCLRHVFIVQRSSSHQHMMESPQFHVYIMQWCAGQDFITHDGISIITCLRHVFIVHRSRFHHHMMEFPSLHAYITDNLIFNKDID